MKDKPCLIIFVVLIIFGFGFLLRVVTKKPEPEYIAPQIYNYDSLQNVIDSFENIYVGNNKKLQTKIDSFKTNIKEIGIYYEQKIKNLNAISNDSAYSLLPKRYKL